MWSNHTLAWLDGSTGDLQSHPDQLLTNIHSLDSSDVPFPLKVVLVVSDTRNVK